MYNVIGDKMKKTLFILKTSSSKTIVTCIFIAKIMIPILLFTTILSELGIVSYLGAYLSPLMAIFGLPGEASIALILANMLNLYAGIVALQEIILTSEQITIISIMMLISHSLFVEVAVLASLKVKRSYQICLRLTGMILIGILLNIIYLRSFKVEFISSSFPLETFLESIIDINFWLNTLSLFLKNISSTLIEITIIIWIVMLILEILNYFNIVNKINHTVYKVTKHLGITPEANIPLIIGILIGISYGAGSIMYTAKEGKLSKKDIILVATFLMFCHAMIEDTLLFMRIGANPLVIIISRIILAFLFTYIMNKFYDTISTGIEGDKNESS